MAAGRIERNYRYIAITDHTNGLKIAGGLVKALCQTSIINGCLRPFRSLAFGASPLIARSCRTNRVRCSDWNYNAPNGCRRYWHVRVMKQRRMTGRNGLLVWSALAVAALVALSSGLALGGIRLVLALLQLAFTLTIIVWLTRLRWGQVKGAEELQKISHLVEQIKRERETIPPRSARRSRRGNGRQKSDRRW